MPRLLHLVTARLICSATTWYVNAFNYGAAFLCSYGTFRWWLIRLVTAQLSCLVTARHVDAAAAPFSHGEVVLFSDDTVC